MGLSSWFFRPLPSGNEPNDRPENPVAAAVRSIEGNRRFEAESCRCAGSHPRVAPPRQMPFAVVLGCSDARAL